MGSNMFQKQPTKLRAAIVISLAVSLILAILPFVFPNVIIGPFIIANWVLMQTVGWMVLPRFSWRRRFPKPDRHQARLFALVLISFMVAGVVAVENAQGMFRADDLEQLRASTPGRAN